MLTDRILYHVTENALYCVVDSISSEIFTHGDEIHWNSSI